MAFIDAPQHILSFDDGNAAAAARCHTMNSIALNLNRNILVHEETKQCYNHSIKIQIANEWSHFMTLNVCTNKLFQFSSFTFNYYIIALRPNYFVANNLWYITN